MMAHKLTGMAALAAALLASPVAAQDTAVPPADIAAVLACEPGAACETSLPVKIVIVSLFEIGEDEGDVAGEFQLWRERRGLDVRIPFPQGFHDLYYNPETQVLGMVTGIGTARSSASGMALGLDQRFDLAEAYWLVAGIAGIDPEDASIGSVAWARYLVDGDLAHEIDPREIPDDWKHGYFARHTKGPNDRETPVDASGGEMFELNRGLEAWGYALTKDVALPDGDAIAEERSQFVNHPNARKPPFVLEGDQLAAMTFWHGSMMNDWANEWVDYWTEGKGEFVTSAMEETGFITSLTNLDRTGRVDADRVMVIRAGSNFTMPPEGVDAASYLLAENEGYAGLEAAVENLYTVGSVVVDALLADWDRYADTIPSAAPPPQ